MSGFLRFCAIAVAVTLGLLAVGLLITREGAASNRDAMIWACGVVFVGALVGALPLVSAAEGSEGLSAAGGAAARGPAAASRFFAAMLLRLGTVGAGAAAVILRGGVEVEAFLLWLAAGYLVFLIVETGFALRVFRRL